MGPNANRKRVLVAVGSYPPGYGGAGLRIHRTYQRLRQHLPIDICAVTVGGRGGPPAVKQHEGIPVFQTRPHAEFYSQLADIGRLIWRNGPGYFDLVHGLGLSDVATAACAWGLLLRIPIVRELTLDTPIDGGGRLPARIRYRGFKRARLVVALNERLEERLRTGGIAANRIWQRPNPVDPYHFHPPSQIERQTARERFQLSNGDVAHLVLARMQPRKNQLFALSALAHLDGQHKLLLLGPELPGDEAYLAEIRQRIANLGLAERTVLVPSHVDDPLAAYHAADTCWVPSTREGMPNVVSEALCCGLAVIVNRSLGLHGHVRNGDNGFNIDLDPVAFAEAAGQGARLAADPDRRFRIAEAAARFYSAEAIDREFALRLAAILGINPI